MPVATAPEAHSASLDYRTGDATQPVGEGTRMIAHVCNDAGAWGKGFVLALSRRWAAPEKAYRGWHRLRSPKEFQLGQIQVVDVGAGVRVVNMIAQRWIAPVDGIPPIRYDALRSCLERLATEATASHATVHMPRIECGLAGGQWSQVETLIGQTLIAAGVAVTIYDLPGAATPV